MTRTMYCNILTVISLIVTAGDGALSSRKRRGRMISAEDKAWLTNHTQHEPEHIDKLYREFQTDYPNGGIWRSQFSEFFPPGITSLHFCDHIFRTLDTDGNGFLDFKEFIMANDLIAARTVEEKLSWAFKMYDLNNSGSIESGEMINVMKAIYSMVDGNVSEAIRGSTMEKAKSHAEKLFPLIDIDGDGKLSSNEFLRGCLQDLDLLQKLEKIIEFCQPPTAYQSTYY